MKPTTKFVGWPDDYHFDYITISDSSDEELDHDEVIKPITPKNKYTLRQCICQVLKKYNTPKSAVDIWKIMEKEELYVTGSKTPWASVSAVLTSNNDMFKKVQIGKYIINPKALYLDMY